MLEAICVAVVSGLLVKVAWPGRDREGALIVVVAAVPKLRRRVESYDM